MFPNTLCTTQHSVVLFVNHELCEGINFSLGDNLPSDMAMIIHINTAAVRRKARRYNGLYELQFVMHLQEDNLTENERGRMVVRVLLPSSESHYLGPLFSSIYPVTSAVLVDDVPETLKLCFSLDTGVPVDMVAAWPAEMLLVDHVMAILDNDDFSGSLASSHVQNLVRELPFYASGMRRFKNWSDFVRFFSTHYYSWQLVQYSNELHEQLGFSKLMLAGELRLVSKHFINSYIMADKARDLIRYEAFLEFQQLLLSLAGPPDVSKRNPKLNSDAFKILGESRSFRTLNTVNYIRILKLVALDPKRYVLFDPLHPIRIDWKRSDETTPGIADMIPV
ncbi:uncharacterized protein TM35_000212860 [Trypanosoma theileri]|uniref:Uncharacterized protein n=1 Tax=Trypanosoma theileri TaxID=67003 RepID=A0A1X0NU99_9TRYP|nr:uncharacterized protein TM35_000212860 [Trypanosoma theileri]ORC87680.1 hypothetical protein TM35_000212860 [Trypanosoma theileri]